MNRPLRVLRVLTRPNLGGPMRQAVALWHAHAALGLRTLLVVGACRPDEAGVDHDRMRIPRLTPSEVTPESVGLVELVDLQRPPNPLGDLRAQRALRALTLAFAPDVVHTHTSKAGWLGRRAAWQAGVKVVAHTFHGHVLRGYWPAPVSWFMRRLERRLAAKTDLLFAVSDSCAAELAELGITARAEVVPPAVDLGGIDPGQRSAARAELGLTAGERAIGFVGRLVSIKRPDLFLEVLAALPDVKGLVFGDGALRRALEAAATRRVRFFGATEALPRLLPALDVLVIPSEREGCPLAAIEAMAAGVPIVGFDVPGVRDALCQDPASVLVPRAAGVAGMVRAVRDIKPRSAALDLGRYQPAAVARRLAIAYAALTAP